ANQLPPHAPYAESPAKSPPAPYGQPHAPRPPPHFPQVLLLWVPGYSYSELPTEQGLQPPHHPYQTQSTPTPPAPCPPLRPSLTPHAPTRAKVPRRRPSPSLPRQ